MLLTLRLTVVTSREDFTINCELNNNTKLNILSSSCKKSIEINASNFAYFDSRTFDLLTTKIWPTPQSNID